MRYDVRALSADNLITVLTVDAHDAADARQQVEARGLFAATVTPVSRSFPGASRFGSGGARRFPLVLFSQELLALLATGRAQRG